MAFILSGTKMELKKAEGPNKGKCRIGLWTWYYESGEKWKEGNYSDTGCSTRDGSWVVWKKNGKKSEETVYIEGSFESRKNIRYKFFLLLPLLRNLFF